MIYHSTQSYEFLWYLVLRGEKTKRLPNTNFLPFFNGWNKKSGNQTSEIFLKITMNLFTVEVFFSQVAVLNQTTINRAVITKK